MNASRKLLILGICQVGMTLSGSVRAITLPDSSHCSSAGACLVITNDLAFNGGRAILGTTTSTSPVIPAVTGTGVYIGVTGHTTGTDSNANRAAGVFGDVSSANSFGVEGSNHNTGGTTLNGAAVFGDSNFNHVDVWAGRFDGDVTATGYFTSSDRTLKKDIADARYGLNEISKLRPVTYKWNQSESGGDRTEIGLIAQEVQKVIPEIVLPRGPNKTLVLNYQALLPVTIKAIQDQQKIIEEQQARIARLEQRREPALASLVSNAVGMSVALLLGLALIAKALGKTKTQTS